MAMASRCGPGVAAALPREPMDERLLVAAAAGRGGELAAALAAGGNTAAVDKVGELRGLLIEMACLVDS